ncbi:hypothetical protein YT28_11945 [Salmonella enterica subsp. salamae]|nr:hypothetical protein [Salmonella enterica subsp. salamae]
MISSDQKRRRKAPFLCVIQPVGLISAAPSGILHCRMAAQAPYPAYNDSQCRYGAKDAARAITRKISCCSKAASEDIPRSVANYVTGVTERSQRRYGTKDKA